MPLDVEQRKVISVSPIDAPNTTDAAQPMVNTLEGCMTPYSKATNIGATSLTPEYVSTLNSLRRAPAGQLIALANKHSLTAADEVFAPDPAVAAQVTAHTAFIVQLATAEVAENFKRLEQ